MEVITSLIVLIYASTIALGVGSSTLAIGSFLVARSDGTIDPSERRLLGVIYLALRVAMVLILLTVLYITLVTPDVLAGQAGHIFTLIAVLYINALVMTFLKRGMRILPAVQAGTWYTLGFVVNMSTFSLFDLTTPNFILLYAIDIIVFIVIVQAWMAYYKRRAATQLPPSA